MLRTSAPCQARQSTVLPSPLCRLRLRIRLANGKKKTIATAAAKNTIGAHPSCNIRLPGPSELGVQCILMHSRSKVVVRSWDDSITLNGRKFEIATLKPGDELRISGCSIRILKSGKKEKKPKPAPSLDSGFGKRLVGEIGKRLAHLEHRLVTRQRRLTRQLEATASQALPTTSPSAKPAATIPEPIASPVAPSPIVVEGLSTLRSAVEELRARVEDVALRPWPKVKNPEPLDTEALLNSASAKMGEIVQLSLREDRTHTALKFEQISRDFDRISQRLGDVEQKLNLPTSEMLAEQVRPVSEAVEFVRAGLQSIEDRQALEASRFEKLSGGLDALRQSTIERLGAMADKVNAIPPLTKVEQALASVSEQVEGLSREISQRQDLYFTRSDAASLIEQVESAAIARDALQLRIAEMGEHFLGMRSEWNKFQVGASAQIQALVSKIDSLPTQQTSAPTEPIDFSPIVGKLEDRFAEMGEHFTTLRGEWTEFQSGTNDQLRALTTKLDALPEQSVPVPVEAVDLTPIEQKLAEHDAQLADQTRVLSECFASQQQFASKLTATESSIEELRSEVSSSKVHAEQIEQLSADNAATRSLAEEAIEQTKNIQSSLLEQLIALEDRCVYLESELARLSHVAPVAPTSYAPMSEVAPAYAPLASSADKVSRYDSPVEPISSSYYSNHAENGNSSAEPYSPPIEPVAEAPIEEEYALSPEPHSNAAQFGAFDRSAMIARTAAEETQILSDSTDPISANDDSSPVAVAPNSVLDSLRLSGIWKGDSDKSASEQEESDNTSESMDDPRDVVGTSFLADSAPTKGLDPSKHQGGPSKQGPWASPHPTPAVENEEESIDAYMERLLQRVSGSNGGEVTGAMGVAEHLQRAKLEAAKKRESRPEHSDGEFEYTPKGPAPEKSSDLSALRELALSSANANIQNYQQANKAKTANEKWVVVVVAMTCAIGLLYVCVNYKSDWTFFGAGAAFIVALYWAIQASLTTITAKRPLKPDSKFEAKLKQTPEASPNEVKRRKSDKRGPSLLDQPSAGETFQTLLAERERESSKPE